MRVDVLGRKIIVTVPDKSEGYKRSEAFAALREVHFHEWIDGNTVAISLDVHSEDSTISLVKRLETGARIYGAEISEEAQEIFDKYEELRRFKAEEKARAEEEKRKRNLAISKVRHGCYLCESLKWDGKRWICEAHEKPCEQSMDEIELLFEEWKETGYTAFKRPTPFPVAECKYLEVLK